MFEWLAPAQHLYQLLKSAIFYCTIICEWLAVSDINITSVKVTFMSKHLFQSAFFQGSGGGQTVQSMVGCKKYKHYFSETDISISNIHLADQMLCGLKINRPGQVGCPLGQRELN